MGDFPCEGASSLTAQDEEEEEEASRKPGGTSKAWTQLKQMEASNFRPGKWESSHALRGRALCILDMTLGRCLFEDMDEWLRMNIPQSLQTEFGH